MENFRTGFTKMAAQVFGSGYVWLSVKGGAELVLHSLPNQDCPLMVGMQPLLCIDLWEHAYYLKYQNRRPEYVEAYWRMIDWQQVSRLWEKATQKATRGTGAKAA